jgi:hypothetical protein
MDNKTLGVILWVVAAGLFVLYFMRRRARKTKQFR